MYLVDREGLMIGFWWRPDEWMLHWFHCTCGTVWVQFGPFELYVEA